jgi:glutaredoxin
MDSICAPGAVTVVSKPDCKWCALAKDDLAARGVPFREVQWADLDGAAAGAALREAVRPKPLTFPQIFVGAERVDRGYQGLFELMERGDDFAKCLQRNGVAPRLTLDADF